MSTSDAKLMRAIGRELLDRIAPELQTADARERVAFMKAVLDLMAADLDVLPGLAVEGAPLLREALEQGISLLPNSLACEAESYRRTLAGKSGQNSDSTANEPILLRDLAARIARKIGDIPADRLTPQERQNVARAQALIAAADRNWLRSFDAARQAKSQGGPSPDAAAPPASELVTPQSVTDYLRRKYPQFQRLTAKSVTQIPGGRSKRTILIALEHSGTLPSQVVMRQDMYLKPTGTTVGDEHRPLKLLSDLGLPVPRPIHFEPEPSVLGPPFLLVERVEGEVPGNYFGTDFACPGAFADLARALARLHRIAPGDAGVTRRTAEGPHGRMGDQVEEFWSQWRKNSIWPSPIVESAYCWARSEYAASTGSTALVHGDCGPHNLLVRDGRLTGLLDWEFLHIGDPAEDLGIACVYAETMMPWQHFMDAYKEAGGAEVPERRIRLAALLHYLKGTVLVAASGRNFAEGATNDFIKGANSYTGLRRIEMKIVEFFDRIAVS